MNVTHRFIVRLGVVFGYELWVKRFKDYMYRPVLSKVGVDNTFAPKPSRALACLFDIWLHCDTWFERNARHLACL